MIYTVTFNPAIDYIVHTGTMQVGQVNRSQGEELYFGGKGINVSFVLHELGLPSKALGFVAGFTGAAIEAGIQEQGIATDFVHLDSGFSRINVKIKSGEETELNGQGPNISEAAVAELFEKLNQLQDGDILILAGSIPNTMPADSYEKILAHLSDKNIKVVVDATKDLLLKVLPYHPFLIKPNNHELGELFGVTLHSIEEIATYAKKLQEMGAQNVLISMAGDGALLIDETGKQHVCGVCKGTVKNSVGAGDSMVAALAYCESQKRSALDACRLAVAFGSASVTMGGTQVPPLDTVNSLYGQVKIMEV